MDIGNAFFVYLITASFAVWLNYIIIALPVAIISFILLVAFDKKK